MGVRHPSRIPSLLGSYSTRHSRSLMFLTLKTACHSIKFVLLPCFNAQPYIFAVVNCADVALSVLFSPDLTCCRIRAWFKL